MLRPVFIPLLNPNEPEAVIAGLEVQEEQAVRAGQVLANLETTKSTSDLLAERDGFVLGIRFQPGQSAHAGEVFCYLADSPDEKLPSDADPFPDKAQASGREAGLPAGLRITAPALALASKHGLALSVFPADRLVTEALVREKLFASTENQPAAPVDPSALIIYGGGGHGKTLIELVRAQGLYRVAGVIDDGMAPGASVLGVPVLGGAEALASPYQAGVQLAVNAVGGIGNLAVRLKVFERLAQAGFEFPVVVHPRAFTEPSAQLSPGVQVFALAYIGSDVRVGFGSIVNTSAILSHDCGLGDYVNISPGAILAGGVQVGERSLVGMGVTINLEVKVGSDCRIGNGATVKADVPAGTLVKAGTIWPLS